MYFCYGWPKVLAVDSRREDVVYLHLDQDFFVLVSTESIQVWSGGQQRVRLGLLKRDQTSVAEEGLNRRAVWCPSRRLLAVLVRPYHRPPHLFGDLTLCTCKLQTSFLRKGSPHLYSVRLLAIHLVLAATVPP